MCLTAPLDPAEVGQDLQSRVVGRDTGPPVPHASHIFDNLVDKEILSYF